MNYLRSCLTDEEKYFYHEKCQGRIIHLSDVEYHGDEPQIGKCKRNEKAKRSQWTCSASTYDSTYV